MSLPTIEGVRLHPATRCVLVLEYKCPRCADVAKHYVQLDRRPASEAEADKLLLQAMGSKPMLLHRCSGEHDGYVAFAQLQGGAFVFAIHAPSGDGPAPPGRLILP